MCATPAPRLTQRTWRKRATRAPRGVGGAARRAQRAQRDKNAVRTGELEWIARRAMAADGRPQSEEACRHTDTRAKAMSRPTDTRLATRLEHRTFAVAFAVDRAIPRGAVKPGTF